MQPNISDNRPGCFASPLCYHANKTLCGECVFEAECGTQAEERSERLMERFGIQELMVKPGRLPSTATSVRKARKPTTPKHNPMDLVAIKQVERLRAQGIDLADMVAHEEIPTTREVPAYIAEAVQSLLNGECNAAHLAQHYQDVWSWPPNNAATCALLAIKVLEHSGAARFQSGSKYMVPTGAEEMVAA